MSHSNEIFTLINEAYKIELGDVGIAYKKLPRLLNPLDTGLDEAYSEKRVIIAHNSKSIVGVVVWQLTSCT